MVVAEEADVGAATEVGVACNDRLRGMGTAMMFGVATGVVVDDEVD